MGVVDLLLGEFGVDDVGNTIDGEGGLGDVGGYGDLAAGGSPGDPGWGYGSEDGELLGGCEG